MQPQHGEGDEAVDILVTGEGVTRFAAPRIPSRNAHGTGCTLSSAIATLLGRGLPLAEAVGQARHFVFEAIRAAPGYGAGNGPLGHQAVRAAD